MDRPGSSTRPAPTNEPDVSDWEGHEFAAGDRAYIAGPYEELMKIVGLDHTTVVTP